MKHTKLTLLLIAFSIAISSGVSRADSSYVFIFAFPQSTNEGSNSSYLDNSAILSEKALQQAKKSPIKNEFFAETTLFNDKLQQFIASIFISPSEKVIRGEDSITKKVNCSNK